MKQVEEQYINRRYHLHCLHRNKKPRPTHVSPEDWAWLIKHVWTDEDFQVLIFFNIIVPCSMHNNWYAWNLLYRKEATRMQLTGQSRRWALKWELNQLLKLHMNWWEQYSHLSFTFSVFLLTVQLIFSFTCRETKRQVNGLQQCKFGKQPIKRLMEHGLFLMVNEFWYISLLMTTCFFRFRPKLYDMCQCTFWVVLFYHWKHFHLPYLYDSFAYCCFHTTNASITLKFHLNKSTSQEVHTKWARWTTELCCC